MRTFLIIYQLDDYGTDYSNLSTYIKNNFEWIKLMQRTWLVKSKKSIKMIRSELAQVAEKGIKLTVFDVTNSNWSTYAIDPNYNSWMRDNILPL